MEVAKDGYLELYVNELDDLKKPTDVKVYLKLLSEDYDFDDLTELKEFFIYRQKPELAKAVDDYLK